MVMVHTSANTNVVQRKQECNRTYKRTKKLFALFVKARPSCFGNQDTTHLREFAIFV